MDAGWAKVEGIADAGQLVAVYNLEVEDDHTYFVGGAGWGWPSGRTTWSVGQRGP